MFIQDLPMVVTAADGVSLHCRHVGLFHYSDLPPDGEATGLLDKSLPARVGSIDC